MSRICVAPLSKPSIVLSTDQQQEAYEELDDMLSKGTLSSVWVGHVTCTHVDKQRY